MKTLIKKLNIQFKSIYISIRVYLFILRFIMRQKPFNVIDLDTYLELESIISRWKKESNPITFIVEILSVLLQEDEEVIRLIKMNKITVALLTNFNKKLFTPITMADFDHSDSTFSDFIDNEKLLELGKKSQAIKRICKAGNISIDKAQDAIEWYGSYYNWSRKIKTTYKDIFLVSKDETYEDNKEIKIPKKQERKTFGGNVEEIKMKAKNNWKYYDIIDRVADGDFTKYDFILSSKTEVVLTKLAHLIYKSKV